MLRLIVLLCCCTLPTIPRAQPYALTPDNTQFQFSVKAIGLVPVTGSFTEFSGSLDLTPDAIEHSTLTLTVAANSVRTIHSTIDNVLRGALFFDTQNHPNITFTSDTVTQVDAARANMAGQLTMRGWSQPITLTINRTTPCAGAYCFTGTTSVNRKKWGMTAYRPLVSNKVKLTFTTILAQTQSVD